MLPFRISICRARSALFADRVVKHRVIESTVMGQGASLVSATAMFAVAISQYFLTDASQVVETFGGCVLSLTWATALALSSLLVWGGYLARNPKVALALEVPGTFLLGVGIAAYGFAVLGERGFEGSTFIIALTWAKGVNLIARAWMLHRRRKSVWIVNRQLKSLL